MLSAAWPSTTQQATLSGDWRDTCSSSVDIDAAIDAGDEELLRFPFSEQAQAALDAQAAAGQHDDRIGGADPAP